MNEGLTDWLTEEVYFFLLQLDGGKQSAAEQRCLQRIHKLGVTVSIRLKIPPPPPQLSFLQSGFIYLFIVVIVLVENEEEEEERGERRRRKRRRRRDDVSLLKVI